MDKEFHAAHRNGKKTGYLRRATPACVRQELSCEMATMIRRVTPEAVFENVGRVLRHHGRAIAAVWSALMTIDESRLVKIQLATAKRAERMPGATPLSVDTAVKETFHAMLINAAVHIYASSLINPADGAFRIDQGIGRSSKETVWFMTATVMGRMLAPSRTGVVFGHVLRYVFTAAMLLVRHDSLKVHVDRCLTLKNVLGPATKRFVENDVAIHIRRAKMIDRALVDCQRIIHGDPSKTEDVLAEMRNPKSLRYYQAVVPINTRPECIRLMTEWIKSGTPVQPALYTDASPATSMIQTSPEANAIRESPLPPILGAGAVTEASGEFIMCVGHNKVEVGRGWPASIPKYDMESMSVSPESVIMALRNANPPTGRIDSAIEPSKLERFLAEALRTHIELGPLNAMFVRVGDKAAYRTVSDIETKIDTFRTKGDDGSMVAREFAVDVAYDNVPPERRKALRRLYKAAIEEAQADAGTVMKMPQYVRKDASAPRPRKSKKAKLDEELKRAADDFDDAMPTFPQEDAIGGIDDDDDFGDLLLGDDLDDIDVGGGWSAGISALPTLAELDPILPVYQPNPASPPVSHPGPVLGDPVNGVTEEDGTTAIEAHKHGLEIQGPKTVGMMDTRSLLAAVIRCEALCKSHQTNPLFIKAFVDTNVVGVYYLERAAAEMRTVFDRAIQVDHANEFVHNAAAMASNVFALMASAEMSREDQVALIKTLIQTYPSVFIAPPALNVGTVGVDGVTKASKETAGSIRFAGAARQAIYELLFSVTMPNGGNFEIDVGGDYGGVASRLARACQHAMMTLSVGIIGAVQRANVLGGVLTMGKVHPSKFMNRRVRDIADQPHPASSPTVIALDVPYQPIMTDPLVEAINMISQPVLSMFGDIETVTRYFGEQAKIMTRHGVVSDGVVHDAVHRLLLESEVPAVRYVGGDPASPEAWRFEKTDETILLLGRKASVCWIYVCIEHPEGNWLVHTVGEIRITVTLSRNEKYRYIKRVFDLDFGQEEGYNALYKDVFDTVRAMAEGESWTEESHTPYCYALANASETTMVDDKPELVDGTFMATLRLGQILMIQPKGLQ